MFSKQPSILQKLLSSELTGTYVLILYSGLFVAIISNAKNTTMCLFFASFAYVIIHSIISLMYV